MQSIQAILIGLSVIAGAVERVMEMSKSLYLRIINSFTKKPREELTRAEKITMTVVLSVIACWLWGAGIDLPEINEPLILQYILAGLIASMGSGLIHQLIGIFEGISKRVRLPSVKNDDEG